MARGTVEPGALVGHQQKKSRNKEISKAESTMAMTSSEKRTQRQRMFAKQVEHTGYQHLSSLPLQHRVE